MKTNLESQIDNIKSWMSLPPLLCPFLTYASRCDICKRHFGAKVVLANRDSISYGVPFFRLGVQLITCPCNAHGIDAVEEMAQQLIDMAPQLIGRYKSL